MVCLQENDVSCGDLLVAAVRLVGRLVRILFALAFFSKKYSTGKSIQAQYVIISV